MSKLHTAQTLGAGPQSQVSRHMARVFVAPKSAREEREAKQEQIIRVCRAAMDIAGHDMGAIGTASRTGNSYAFCTCRNCGQKVEVMGYCRPDYVDALSAARSAAPSPCVAISSRPLPSNDEQVRNATLAAGF